MTLIYTAKDAEALATRLKAEGTSRAGIVQELSACCMGWPYVFAAAGEECTPEWRKNRARHSNDQYAKAIVDNCPVLSGKNTSSVTLRATPSPQGEGLCAGCKWAGVLCFDCRGFTRWLLAQAGVPLYGETVTTQWETSANWAAKGNIDTLPHSLVCCVFRPKHTGMYLGNGTVRHCGGRKGQVVEEALPGNPKWERWGIPAGLYTNDELRKAGVNVDESKNIPTLRRGSRGEQVKLLQETLNELPAGAALDLKVDGIFGKDTETAVKSFQADHGLTVDGIVGPKTWKALGISSQSLPLEGGRSARETVQWTVFSEGRAAAPDGGASAPDEVDSSKESRARYIWDKLYTAIRNPYGVAGLMGNLQAESGLNQENLQGTGNRALGMTDAEYTAAVDIGAYTAEQFTDDGFGYGIAQWTYRTRKAALLKYAKERGKSIGNLDMQIDFLLDELLGSYSSVWYALLNATTVREASDAVLLKYERPKNTSEENQQRRAEIGQEFYDRFVKGIHAPGNTQNAENRNPEPSPDTQTGGFDPVPDDVILSRPDPDGASEESPLLAVKPVDVVILKSLYAQAAAMAGTLKKIIEGE